LILSNWNDAVFVVAFHAAPNEFAPFCSVFRRLVELIQPRQQDREARAGLLRERILQERADLRAR
jgi:hypothetical protein